MAHDLSDMLRSILKFGAAQPRSVTVSGNEMCEHGLSDREIEIFFLDFFFSMVDLFFRLDGLLRLSPRPAGESYGSLLSYLLGKI